MGGATQTTPGLVFYRCPRCEQAGLHLVCPNCRKSEFRLLKREAVCACDHRLKTFACGCGATVAAKFFTVEQTGVPRPGSQPAPEPSETVLKTGYGWFKTVHSIRDQGLFACSILGLFVPAGFGTWVLDQGKSFGEILLTTAPMTLGIALAVRILLAEENNPFGKVLAGALCLIGTAWIGIGLGAIAGAKNGDLFAPNFPSWGGLYQTVVNVFTLYYHRFGTGTFYTFLVVGTAIGLSWKYVPEYLENR